MDQETTVQGEASLQTPDQTALGQEARPSEDLTGLISKRDELLSKVKTFKDREAKLQAELEEYRSLDKKRKLTQLEEQKRYEEANKVRDEELHALREKVGYFESGIANARKITAFKSALNAPTFDIQKYKGLIDLGQIDAEDTEALTAYAKNFKEEYSTLFAQPTNKGQPSSFEPRSINNLESETEGQAPTHKYNATPEGEQDMFMALVQSQHR